MNTIKSGKWLLSAVVPALLIGCQPAQRVAGPKPTAQQIPRLTSAYLAVAKPRQDPHPSTRLPIRRAQKRNLRVLAQQCDELLKDVQAWDSDAHLTSIDAAERDEVRITVATFRDSLEQLRQAAERGSVSNLRTHYGAALTSYAHLTKITETVE